MAEIGRWNGHKFEVSSSLIRSFTGLQIKGSSETEDKEDGSQKYVSRKKGKPVEVSFTIHLNARLGCDVRSEALKFVSEARAGSKDYFYVGNKKLVTCQLMLTDATVKEIGLINKGTWTQADVQVTMKQCSKNDGASGGGSSSGGGGGGGSSSGGSKKVSVKKTSTTTTKNTNVVQKIADGIKNVATKVVNGVKKAVATVKNVLTGKTSLASAVTSAVKAGVSAVKKVATAAKAVSTVKKATTTSSAVSKIKSVVSKVTSLFKKK
ncbi:MAG: hypothetical protein IKO07_05700 [Clostridia bacterium]|nr:hypothetical protein [Clostridia bacterium]